MGGVLVASGLALCFAQPLIGEKSLAKGEVELKLRGGALTPIKPDEVVARVRELLAANV